MLQSHPQEVIFQFYECHLNFYVQFDVNFIISLPENLIENELEVAK